MKIDARAVAHRLMRDGGARCGECRRWTNTLCLRTWLVGRYAIRAELCIQCWAAA